MVIQIPEKLKQKGIRFVLLEKSGKKPFQNEWQNKSIEFDNEELLNHLEKEGNYGVMGGGLKQLVIIDFDNEELQKKILSKLPRTFTIKTGSGKLHKYFFSDKCESFKIFDENMNTLADVQGEGKQVVGANSIHPNGNRYEVEDDFDINFLPYAEIKALLIPFDKKPKKEKKIQEKTNFDIGDDFLDNLKSSVSMEDVLSSFGIDTSKNPTACPFHSSQGGKCLGFNNEIAHCFHCDNAWNIFSFVKDMKRCDFRESLEYLANLSGLQDELEISRKKYIERLKVQQKDEKRDVKDMFLDFVKNKKWGDATEVLVNWILRNNYIYTTKDDLKTEMWIYKEGIYIPQGKSEVKELLRDLLGNWYNAFYYNQVINKLEPDTFINIDEFFNQRHTDEIPVKNGILNLCSRELKPFSPEKIFFCKLNAEYNRYADCPQIDKFLSEILSDKDDKLVFYEIGGFSLWKEYTFEKAFMFVGNGRNGKDKSLELIKRILGLENCCSVPLSSLSPDSFIMSEFFGKMVNIAGDIGNKDLKDTSSFKALTGRSLVSAPRKFLKPITFQNYAKFIFACNDLPMVYDSSKGFWDRWVLLEFPYTFVPDEELKKAKDKTLLKLRDEDIIEKIISPQEMSGLLNKFLDGLDRLRDKRVFSSTKGSDEIKELWIRKSNSFMAFCMDFLESEYDNKITKKELRKRYTDYCKLHKVTPKTDYVIKRTLEELFGAIEDRDYTNWGGVRCWEGIKWKK